MASGYDYPKTAGTGSQAKKSNDNLSKKIEAENQVERPKCGAVGKKKVEDEDWDERVTDAGDWKKVSFYPFCPFFSSSNRFILCRLTLDAPSYISPAFPLCQGNFFLSI